MQKRLLILGAGINQLTAIKTAIEKGHFVVAIDPSPTAPGFSIANAFYVYDLADKKACLNIAMQHRIDGVLTIASEYPMPLAAYIAEALSLPGLTPQVVSRATNKRLMRECFDKHDVPSPKSYVVKSSNDARSIYEHSKTNVIVKPAISHGGRGIKKLAPNLQSQTAIMAFKRALVHSRNDEVLIEEFVEGDEFSVEAITCNGVTNIIAVTKKYTSGAPYFVEIAHTQPSNLSAKKLEKVHTIVINALVALGIDNSPSHTELKIDGDTIKIIEVGARLGGGFITSHLVALSTGVNMVEACIDLALGQTPNIKINQNKGAAIAFIKATPGSVINIYGVEEVKQLSYICEVELYLSIGDKVELLEDATDRIGHIIATGEDAQAAEKNLATAMQLIDIQTEELEHTNQ